MVMGMIVLGRRYPPSKYISVLMITCGIILCTIISGTEIVSQSFTYQEILLYNLPLSFQKETRGTHAGESAPETNPTVVFFHWVLGITLLTVALFISAGMGIYQERLYAKHGKHPFEALYYTHLMPLPGFLLFSTNISEHFGIVLSSAPVTLPLLPFALPLQLLYLVGNVLTQFVCIASVYILTTEASALTVTLIVTLRKFTSLLFSIVYFKNQFTICHWLGTICVFYGTVIFTDLIPNVRKSLSTARKESQDLKKAE